MIFSRWPLAYEIYFGERIHTFVLFIISQHWEESKYVLMEDKDPFILHIQYQSGWWLGATRSDGQAAIVSS